MAITKIKYNGEVLNTTNNSLPINISYKGSVLTQVSHGTSKTLKCAYKLMGGDVSVGSKTLKINNRIPQYDIVVEVDPLAKIDIPTMATKSFTYTGSSITPTVSGYDSSTMDRTGDVSGTNVKSNYSIVYSIKDKSTYCWNDSSSSQTDKTLNWSITKKNISLPSLSFSSVEWDGTTKTVTPTYDSSWVNTPTGTLSAVAVNSSYSVTFSLKDKTNTQWSDGTTADIIKTWAITKKNITVPTASNTSFTYTLNTAQGPNVTNPDSAYINQGGTASATNAGSYSISFTLKDTANTQWKSTYSNIDWSISKRTLNVPAQSDTLTYNGSAQTPSWNNDYDTNYMTVSVVSQTNAGSNYTASFSLKDTSNTQWSGGGTAAQSASWSINRASVGAKPSTTTKTVKWTGSEQTNGYTKPNYVDMTGSDRGTEVNTSGYSATYTPDSNHCWSDNTYSSVTVKLIINKADGVLTLNGTAGNASLGTINSGGSSTVTVASHDNSKVTFTTSASTDYLTLSYASDNSTVTLAHGGNTGSSNRSVSVTVTCAADNHHESISRTISATMAKTSSCVASDTLIMMGDGSEKMIKDVKRGESIMTYNMDTGKFEPQAATILWDEHHIVSPVSMHLTFDDGTLIKVIWEHGFFDKTLNTYSYINYNNCNNFIGHDFVAYDKDGYRLVKLIKAEVVKAPVEQYSMESAYNDNFITNGLISMTQEPVLGRFEYFKFSDNVTWDQDDKQAKIDKYGLYTYDEWKDYIPSEEMFNAVNGPYFKILMGEGIITMDDIWYMLKELEDGTK